MRKIFISLVAIILWIACVGGGGYLAYQEFVKDQETIIADLKTVIGADVPFFYWGEGETTTPEGEQTHDGEVTE